AVTGQERVLLVPQLGVRLSEREDRILDRMKQVGATPVLRGIERLGRVADRSKRKRVPEPPRLGGKPATEYPPPVLRVVIVPAIEVERAQMELDRRIAEEWRELLHPFGETRNDEPELRDCGLYRGLRGENTFGRGQLRGQEMQMSRQDLVSRGCQR